VSSDPHAFAAIDRGTATVAVSLIGRVDGRWRLLGATASPAAVPPEALLERLRGRLAASAPDLASALALSAPGSADELPRIACATAAPPEMAVVAATGRALTPLVAAATSAGWRVRPLALDGAEILAVAGALADPTVTALLAGSGEPPGGDERPLIPDLVAIVAAAVQRRPDMVAVLAGGLAEPGGRMEAALPPDRVGATLTAPSPAKGHGTALRLLLEELRGDGSDGRRALVAATATLADVLDRRVEVIEIGQSAGARVAAAPSVAGEGPRDAKAAHGAIVADAALLPRGFGDAHLDAIIGWLSVPLDRLRVRDRLRELALAPWGDAAGDGALLRLAAARAAVGRLLDATPTIDALPAPELVVVAGGAWNVAPPSAVALAVADVIRRSGVRALGLDHARLLAPLGTIPDPAERRLIIDDLRDELVLPLGSVLMPAGMRTGRAAGTLALRSTTGESLLDLVPGGLDLLHLPAGEVAIADVRFRDAVDLGPRVRHAMVQVTGGLAGLLVDLRDVPLRLPDRLEMRREAMASWEARVWAGSEA
jgi:hypothetical protein